MPTGLSCDIGFTLTMSLTKEYIQGDEGIHSVRSRNTIHQAKEYYSSSHTMYCQISCKTYPSSNRHIQQAQPLHRICTTAVIFIGKCIKSLCTFIYSTRLPYTSRLSCIGSEADAESCNNAMTTEVNRDSRDIHITVV